MKNNSYLHCVIYTTVILVVSGLPMVSEAKQCTGNGQLRFLGTSAGNERSVWLSSTAAGAYRLDAAQGNQTVDSWSKNKRKLHVSLSPVVSNGNGGTHKLYTSDDCLLDTQNQKNTFVFPPSITRPPSFRPPTPLTPTLPTLPNLPGGVTPPIATLPPQTLTPTLPTLPNLPGGVTPPIATLPPQTLTPTLPTLPNLPSGVTPPIGTLPEVPVPAPGEFAGEFNGNLRVAPVPSIQPCRNQRLEDPVQTGQLSDCFPLTPQARAVELPLTAGRELVEKNDWNFWMDGSAAHVRDTRDGMDTRGDSNSFSLGVDRVVREDLVVGLQLFFSRANSNSFGDTLKSDLTSYSVGPYISYSPAPNWLLYGALGFGRQTVDTKLLSLSGTADAGQYSLNLQAEGQYAFESIIVRPKMQLSHTYNEGDTYRLKGSILNTPLILNMRNQSFNYGIVQSSVEFSRTFDLGNKRLLLPFIEAGVYYEYSRPNSGQHLTSDLTYAKSSPWGGVLRAGARTLIGNSTMASLDVVNQSVGITDLNIWELRFLVSHSF